MKNNKFRIVFICADCSILAWGLPRTEDAGRLPCLGSQGSQRSEVTEAELRAAPGTSGSVLPHYCSFRGDALWALSNHVVKKSQKSERRENLKLFNYKAVKRKTRKGECLPKVFRVEINRNERSLRELKQFLNTMCLYKYISYLFLCQIKM